MWTPSDYVLDCSADPARIPAEAELIHDRVWRFDFAAPGFCLIDVGPVQSDALRSLMVELKLRLSDIAVRRAGAGFVFRSMGRFDQQETTKFHLDGAPAASLLMLGYEPSDVQSRLFLADFSRCADDLGITPGRFLQEFNPMFRKGEEVLGRYVTELPQPRDGCSRILLINNSSLPFDEGRMNPLGVMHKAEIVTPDESKHRIVNSIMLGLGEHDLIGQAQQHEFIATDAISPKAYQS